MPLPLAAATLYGAGISTAGNLINTALQSGTNKKAREFTEKMYERQRSDALADRLFENQFNSPAEQMKRLKEAGLNPNLVYGNGNATTTSSNTRSSSPGSWTPKAPQLDLSSVSQGIMNYSQVKAQEAQIDNLKAASKVAAQEAALKAAETMRIIMTIPQTKIQTERMDFDLQQAKALAPVSLEKAVADLNKVYADTQYTLNQDERATLLASQSLKEGVVRILQMRLQNAKTEQETRHIKQQIENAKQDYRLKEFDERMQNKGIPRNSSSLIKIASDFLTGNEDSVTPDGKTRQQLLQEMDDWKNDRSRAFKKGSWFPKK